MPSRWPRSPDIDVVVELIGGTDGVARALVEAALANRQARRHRQQGAAGASRHRACRAAPRSKGVALAFEAAVAGGIPIIKALREGLAANRMSRVYGILNGTCNYILTTMRESGRDFADVLAEAQQLGYAEADPSFDIDGIDAAHKLAILAASRSAPRSISPASMSRASATSRALDIDFAEELGYRIKLLGIARLTEHGLEQRVHPCMVPRAHADRRMSRACSTPSWSRAISSAASCSKAAAPAPQPTASAVVADLVDIAAGRRVPASACRRRR